MARKVWTFNVAVDFWRHPKAVQAGRDGRDLFLCGLGWTSEYKKDGRVPQGILATLAGQAGLSESNARKAVRRLVEVGMWEPAEDGWLVHDYHEWQPSREEREAQAARHAANQAAYKARLSAGGQRDVRPDPPPDDPPNDRSPDRTADPPDDRSGTTITDHVREVRGNGFGFAGLESPLNSTSATNGDSEPEPSPNGEIYDQVRADFETFWGTFPKRQGRLRDRVGTLRRWRHLTGTERAKALVAVVNYAAERGDDKPTAAKDPDRWLRDRDWADYLEPVTPVTRLDQRQRPGRLMPSEVLAARQRPPEPPSGDAS